MVGSRQNFAKLFVLYDLNDWEISWDLSSRNLLYDTFVFFFFAVIDVKSNISLRRNDDKRGVSGDLSCCVLMLIRILLGLRLIRHIEIAIIKKKNGRCVRVTLGKGKQHDQLPKSPWLFPLWNWRTRRSRDWSQLYVLYRLTMSNAVMYGRVILSFLS